ncbi:MAG: hypothetical protein OXU62_06340 [Gammaproteobacteria bacterium]|nr:hypothetical protein [Gammaproteobacteria bacterium]
MRDGVDDGGDGRDGGVDDGEGGDDGRDGDNGGGDAGAGDGVAGVDAGVGLGDGGDDDGGDGSGGDGVGDGDGSDAAGRHLPAHEFHYSRARLPPDAKFAYRVQRGYGIDGRFDGWVHANTLANYAHFRHTAANPWVARFLAFIREHR